MAGKQQRRLGAGTIITVLIVAAAFAPLLLHAVRSPATPGAAEPSHDAPIPSQVPPGTTLIVGDPTTQRVLKYTGWDKQLPFKVQWAAISGGPGVTEAFQARAIDLGSAADIPPIHAEWVGIPVKIVAYRLRRDPLSHPTYVLGISPKARIRDLAELKGKKIAYSAGQAQGAVVLRTLDAIGLTPADVTLVDLPATSDIYSGALAAGQVDAAPIGAGLPAKRYLDGYARDGARVLPHPPFRDDPGLLYARAETVRDPAKAAAIRAYVGFWARAHQWIDSHREEWAQAYYVEDQGVKPADAQVIVRAAGAPDIPRDWTGIIALQQQTVNFMAREMGRQSFDAATLFDRRFETAAADAIARTASTSLDRSPAPFPAADKGNRP